MTRKRRTGLVLKVTRCRLSRLSRLSLLFLFRSAAEARWRSLPGVSLCTVPLEVGPDQPRHWLRAAVLKHGESAAAVRMGGNGEAIPRGLGARTAAEGEAPQLQVAGQAPKPSPFYISLKI